MPRIQPLGRLFLAVAMLVLATAAPLLAATYYVDQRAANASDANAGTEQAPWKTITRAGSAKELKPGDQVLIRTGVYREHVEIKVSGEKGQPAPTSGTHHKVAVDAVEGMPGYFANASCAAFVNVGRIFLPSSPGKPACCTMKTVMSLRFGSIDMLVA